MKAAKFREQTTEELRESYEEARKELFDLQVKSTTGDNSIQPLRRRMVRREVARIKTVMREREGVK